MMRSGGRDSGKTERANDPRRGRGTVQDRRPSKAATYSKRCAPPPPALCIMVPHARVFDEAVEQLFAEYSRSQSSLPGQ